jgi:CrcB protein
MDLVFVGIGGALGSIVRYKLGKIITEKSSTTFPTGTFIINISGAVLLGLLSSLGAGKNAYLLLGDGFLGAYTTFSTFMYEGFNLFQENEKMNAFTYILGSLVLGIIGCFAGSEIGNFIKVL